MSYEPKFLGWKDDAGITHKLQWDDDLVIPMWVTSCGLGPVTGSLMNARPATPDCMGCIGYARNIIQCQFCKDTGYLDYAWSDFPCSCSAGDRARFAVVDDRNAVVRICEGSDLKDIIATWKRR